MNSKVYCPVCEKFCGEVYYGVFYLDNNAILGFKCPHCKANIKKGNFRERRLLIK